MERLLPYFTALFLCLRTRLADGWTAFGRYSIKGAGIFITTPRGLENRAVREAYDIFDDVRAAPSFSCLLQVVILLGQMLKAFESTLPWSDLRRRLPNVSTRTSHLLRNNMTELCATLLKTRWRTSYSVSRRRPLAAA